MADPLIDAYNAILAIAESDLDFGPMFSTGRRIKDTQPGWFARYVRSAPAEFPQFRWAFGDGQDAMFTADKSFETEKTTFITDNSDGWIEPVSQNFLATFVYDTEKRDSTYQRGYENAFLTALRRAGPKLNMQAVVSWGPCPIRRGTLTDENVSRPVTRITIPVTFHFSGRDLL